MILTNEFVVQAPLERVWHLFDELEVVIPCMPGAAYIARDGEDNKVSLRVKVGVISANFQGSVCYIEKDAAKHVAVIRGTGKDTGGKASANVTIVARLHALTNDSTRVSVETDLAITGRLAQFGGGTIADIASRTISQFTDNLHRLINATPQVSDAPHTTGAAGNPESHKDAPPSLDLVAMMGPTAIKGMLRRAAVPIVFLILGLLLGKFL